MFYFHPWAKSCIRSSPTYTSLALIAQATTTTTPQITGSKAEDLFRHLATFYANKPIPADTLSEKSILIRWLGLTT